MTATHGIQLLKNETTTRYRPLSYFQANGTSVIQEGQVVILNEDPNFWKVGDGSTTLKNLRWYKSDASPLAPSPGLSNHNFILWDYDTVLGLDYITLGEMGSTTFFSPINYSLAGFNGVLFGRIYDLPEPLNLSYIGVNTLAFTLAPGAVATLTIGLYTLDLNILQANILTSFSVNPTSPGLITNPTPLNLFLPSGKYLVSFHFFNTIPSGSTTTIISGNNKGQQTYSVPQTTSPNMFSMTTRVVTVIPAPPILPLPNVASNLVGSTNVIPLFQLFGTRVIKNL